MCVCASLESQICLIVKVVHGRFFFSIYILIENSMLWGTCNKINKMSVETMSYQCRCVLNDMIRLLLSFGNFWL